ncbi:MAG: precorrin-8X methylmutase [Thermodesulfovibrionales bacterium]
MESIILIGHGSPKRDANNIELVGRLLHNTIHPGCTEGCVRIAYMKYGNPDIPGAIRASVESGSKKVIVHPYFLSSGLHVTEDIPEMIREAEALYPDVEFVYTEPLGTHEKLVHVIMERISTAGGALLPEDIERKSFDILTGEADFAGLPPEQLPIMQRVIHSTADFEFRKTLTFHPDAVAAGLAAIKAGKNILTDIEMVRTGINKRWLKPWGGKVFCTIADDEVIRASKETGKTRAEIAIEQGIDESVGIIAIGNAPTALLKTVEVLNERKLKNPPLVVGVPVGFVKAFESKALLATQRFPFITALSRKGGTPVAVAVVNALLKMANEEAAKEEEVVSGNAKE